MDLRSLVSKLNTKRYVFSSAPPLAYELLKTLNRIYIIIGLSDGVLYYQNKYRVKQDHWHIMSGTKNMYSYKISAFRGGTRVPRLAW